MRRNISTDLHGWVEGRLSDYIDNQLPTAERTQLEQHLTGCAQCQASLASLRWTITLVKQAPAPALQRSFVLPAPAQRAPMFTFGLARLATALATLLLVAVVGVDLLTQFGGNAAAPMAAKSDAANQDIALAPTLTAPAAVLSAPSGAQPTVVTQPTQAPAPPAALPPAPAKTAEPAVEGAPKLPTASPRQPIAGSAMVTATLPSAPTATATQAPATLPPPTSIAKASGEPTRALTPEPASSPQPSVTPMRVAEFAFFFLAIFFGVLMVGLRRR